MVLEIVILSEVNQTEWERSYGIRYMWNLKRNDTSELTKQRVTDLKNKLMVVGLGGRMEKRDSEDVWGGPLHSTIFKMDNQQRPTV